MKNETGTFTSITPSMIQAWREEVARIDVYIKAAQQEIKTKQGAKDKLCQLIQVGQGLLPAAPSKPTPKKEIQLAPIPVDKADQRYKAGSWTNTMQSILEDANRGMTYQEVRTALEGTHLAEKLANTDKSFYGAIDKLSNKKKIFKHNGRLFSLHAFAQFQKDVEAGRVKDEPVAGHRGNRSPVGEAIIAILKEKPNGAKSGDLKQALEKDESFQSSLKHKSFLYNVLTTLQNKGQVAKEGEYYRVVS